MWSDDANALTSADSQAFKRSAECFWHRPVISGASRNCGVTSTLRSAADLNKFTLLLSPRWLPRSPARALQARRSRGRRRFTKAATGQWFAHAAYSAADYPPCGTDASAPTRDELLVKKALYIQLWVSHSTTTPPQGQRVPSLGTPLGRRGPTDYALAQRACDLLTHTSSSPPAVAPQIVDRFWILQSPDLRDCALHGSTRQRSARPGDSRDCLAA